MSYLNTLSKEQKKNIDLIINQAVKSGITNPNSIAAILAIVSKESEFIPKSENLNYSASRLVKVFNLSQSRANQLANKPEAIGNAIYGGRYGNAKDEGYKYRGRGFNQLTFKDNYRDYGLLVGENLVANPDKVNEPKIAAKVLMEYNKLAIKALKNNGKLSSYNSGEINDFKNLNDSTLAFYHATAGPGKSVDYVKGLKSYDPYGGMTKALNRVNDLHAYVKTKLNNIVKEDGKSINWKKVFAISIGLLAVYVLYNKVIKKK